jgi:hypothetical protein
MAKATGEVKKSAKKKKKRVGNPKGYRQTTMKPEQIVAIQPHLDELIRRYQDFFENGVTSIPDPICATVGTGECFSCPVFGEPWPPGWDGGPPCERYIPKAPTHVENTRYGIHGGGTNPKWWAADVIEFLETLRLPDPEPDPE